MESHVSQRTRDPSTRLRAGYGAPTHGGDGGQQVPHRAFSPIRNDKIFVPGVAARLRSFPDTNPKNVPQGLKPSLGGKSIAALKALRHPKSKGLQHD